jgi:inward rectifier potassium channel
MSLFGKLNNTAQTQDNTGFGKNTADNAGRFFNKNGEPNVEKKGVTFLQRISWYHTMLALPRWKFFALIILFYVLVNLFFATIYYIAGVEKLNGVTTDNELEKFWHAFFFSAQTLTTVGYGHVSPSGFLMSAIAAIEALVGLLSLALATGLLYGRFSKPVAYIKFSDNALITPFEDGLGLMLRIAPFKNTTLTDVIAKITIGMVVEKNGKMVNDFFVVQLEYDRINALTLSWTIVHPITPDSPLFNFTKEDFAKTTGEVIVFIKAFDDMFSNTVVARSSYTFKEIVYGAKFEAMYHRNNSESATVLELEKLNSFINIDANVATLNKAVNE